MSVDMQIVRDPFYARDGERDLERTVGAADGPGREQHQVFLQRIGQPAADCLFIDDSAANIASARQLGFSTILFESEDQLEQELAVRGLLD